jgi:hypothetical protein
MTGLCNTCRHNKQGKHSMHCHHKGAIKYKDIKNPCDNCGRKPNVKRKGCGKCIGRGIYTYHFTYNVCDCGKYYRI